jgi:lysozyme family protein
MARSNFPAALKELLIHEGGYVNHPKDPGGRTNLGVTQRVYEAWVKHPVDEKIMRSLTVDHVRALYKAQYWDAVKADDLPPGLDLCVFDFAVNAGPRRGARYLQRLVGTTRDGIIGPATLGAVREYVRKHGVEGAINAYQDSRVGYYKRLRTFPTFGRGWLRRVEEVRKAALQMARACV